MPLLRPILLQSDRWIEKGDFRSETKSGIVTQSQNFLCDPIFFDGAIRSAHPVEKVDFFNAGCADRIARLFQRGMRGSDCSIKKLFEAHRIAYQPTKHTITPYTPYNSSVLA